MAEQHEQSCKATGQAYETLQTSTLAGRLLAHVVPQRMACASLWLGDPALFDGFDGALRAMHGHSKVAIHDGKQRSVETRKAQVRLAHGLISAFY